MIKERWQSAVEQQQSTYSSHVLEKRCQLIATRGSGNNYLPLPWLQLLFWMPSLALYPFKEENFELYFLAFSKLGQIKGLSYYLFSILFSYSKVAKYKQPFHYTRGLGQPSFITVIYWIINFNQKSESCILKKSFVCLL